MRKIILVISALLMGALAAHAQYFPITDYLRRR